MYFGEARSRGIFQVAAKALAQPPNSRARCSDRQDDALVQITFAVDRPEAARGCSDGVADHSTNGRDWALGRARSDITDHGDPPGWTCTYVLQLRA